MEGMEVALMAVMAAGLMAMAWMEEMEVVLMVVFLMVVEQVEAVVVVLTSRLTSRLPQFLMVRLKMLTTTLIIVFLGRVVLLLVWVELVGEQVAVRVEMVVEQAAVLVVRVAVLVELAIVQVVERLPL